MASLQSVHSAARSYIGGAYGAVWRALTSAVSAKSDVPVERRESRLIGLGGVIIVIFIAGFAGLMVRQTNQASRTSNQDHVEQLLRAVTHQLGTMLVGIEKTMLHAGDEIRESDRPQKLAELSNAGRVSLHLLNDLIFIDRHGRVVVSSMRSHEVASMSNRADREYFNIHLDNPRTSSRIGRSLRGHPTGLDLIPVSHAVLGLNGKLMGVLVALIDVKALERIWVDVGLKPGDRIDLIGEDGKTWFSWPEGVAAAGAAGDSTKWSQPIPGWSMQVVATLEQATIDRHSFGAKRAIVISATAGSLMVGLLCLVLAYRHAANGLVKARLLATIEALPIEFMEYDREKKLILINQAARLSQGWGSHSMGKTERELLEETLIEKRAENSDHDWDKFMAYRRAIGTDRTGTYELTRPNGVSGRFFVENMPGGGRVVMRIDITESKQREAELMATKDRYLLLFDTIPYPMVVVTLDTRRILTVNNAAIEQYGWSREEFLTMRSDDFYLPEDRPALRVMRERHVAGSADTIQGLRHRRKDGTIIDVEMDVRPIEFNGAPAMLVLCRDTSERLRVERARVAAEEQLRQSQKMEAVGQLTGGIAHDFNNVLTVILANADALQEDGLDDKLAERVEEIAQAVLRASDLTRQLLAFSRKQALDPKRTDLNDLVSGTGKLLRRALGEHIEIDSLLADDLWTVSVDRAQLETALVNLCVNARDAMPGGGKLLIETRNVSLEANSGSDVVAGDYVMLAVIDTGSGIPPEALARVFEPFFTTKEVGKGTGLGLSMVYGFIKQSSGHITIDSELGRGTTFKLYLPRNDEVQETAAVRPAAPMPRGTERILVVEDEPQVRASVVAQLQSLGYAVSSASDGAAGIVAFEAATLPFDLLLTDVVMPGSLNGRLLADEVARRWPTAKIVFMSGYTGTALEQNGQLDADVLLLSKPFRKNDLAQILHLALDAPA